MSSSDGDQHALNDEAIDSESQHEPEQKMDITSGEDIELEGVRTPVVAADDEDDNESRRGNVADTPSTSKDRTLREFLGMMDQYAPIIPDAVTDHYLGVAGFECEDPRIKRLLALAAQKFIADIAQDAYQYSKIRTSGGASGAVASMPQAAPRGGRYGKDRGRAVLTMDDLASAVQEYGINLKRPDFYR